MVWKLNKEDEYTTKDETAFETMRTERGPRIFVKTFEYHFNPSLKTFRRVLRSGVSFGLMNFFLGMCDI